MFLFKKIVGPLLFPLPMALFLLLLGLGLLWFTRKQKAGKLFMTAGTLLLIASSFGTFARWTLVPLERQYPPLITSATTTTSESPIKWIVVLGGGGYYSPQIPSSSQLSSASLARLAEGIRLHRQLPGAKLILSEGSIFQTTPVADVMGNVARDLGVAGEVIILERQSQDTESQAALILPAVGHDRFILVTSASHMPRAMGLFRKLGMNPIAAPTDFRSLSGDSLQPSSFFPSSGELRKAEVAMHEYLGLAWSRMRGKI